MKLGLISSIAGSLGYEEMIDLVAEAGLDCVEVACWPQEKAARRYAGVSHIDVERILADDAYCEHVLGYAKEKGIEISSLAYYPNNMDSDPVKRKAANDHLVKVMEASAKMGIGMVTTFIGRDQNKNVEENMELVKQVWPPLMEKAVSLGIRVAIENCPMLFGPDQWPGGQNIMSSPANWKKVFEILPYDNLGLNYDPSHLVLQQMDYLKPVTAFREKLFHVHCKDMHIDRDKLDEWGVFSYPLNWSVPRIPGYGDINWGHYISTLREAGYDGYVCIEVEDRSFEGSEEDIRKSVLLSAKYLRNFVM